MADIREYRQVRDQLDDRGRQRGRGSMINYYADQGFSSTEEYNKGWKENQTKFDLDKAKAEEIISNRNKEISEFEGTAFKAKGELESARTDYQKNLVPVLVYDKSGNNIIGKYTLPREAAESLYGNTKQLLSSWGADESPYWLGVEGNDPARYPKAAPVRPGGDADPQELDAYQEALYNYNNPEPYTPSSAPKNTLHVKTISKDANHPFRQQLDLIQLEVDARMAEAEGEFRKSQSIIDTAYSDINRAKEDVGMVQSQNVQAEAERNTQIQKMRDEYQNRLARLKEVYGGLNVEGT